MRTATPNPLAALDLEIQRAWVRLLMARSNDEIDKRMAAVDALLDQRLLLTGPKGLEVVVQLAGHPPLTSGQVGDAGSNPARPRQP